MTTRTTNIIGGTLLGLAAGFTALIIGAGVHHLLASVPAELAGFTLGFFAVAGGVAGATQRRPPRGPRPTSVILDEISVDVDDSGNTTITGPWADRDPFGDDWKGHR